MYRKILCLSIVMLVITTGCSPEVDNNTDAFEMKSKIIKLEEENSNLKTIIEEVVSESNNLELINAALTLELEESIKNKTDSNIERMIQRDNFTLLSETVHKFVKAHIDGDLKVLEECMSDNYELKEVNGDIIAHDIEENYDLTLHNSSRSKEYLDKVIRTQWYIEERSSYYFNVLEYYKGDYDSTLFLNIEMKETEQGWKIQKVEMDI